MERRRFLELALTLSATGGMSLLGLTGCGGGKSTYSSPGSNGAAGATRQVRGTVTLPSGFSLPLSLLTAATGFGLSAIGQDGAFTGSVLDQANSGPTLFWVQNADTVLLMGFGGENGAVTVSAESTAVALIYFALGGFSLPAATRGTLLGLIASDASLPPLVRVVEQQIGANPAALMQDNAIIGNAVKAVLVALGATEALQISRSATRNAATSSRSRAIDAQTLISPSGLQSNVELVQGQSAQSFIATNHSRRYCRVYSYKTGFQDADGNRTDYPAAKPEEGPVKLTSTAALSVFSTITNFTSGQTAFVPVSTPDIRLETQTDAARTFFDVIVLGSAASLSEPGFYSDPKYAAFVPDWRSARTTLNLLSWIGDVVLGLLFEIWGLQGLSKSEAAIESAIAKFARAELPISQALQLAGEGRFVDATRAFLAALGSSSDVMIRIRAVLFSVFTEFSGIAVVESQVSAASRVVLRMLETAMNAATLIIGLGDIGAVLHDLISANQGDLWNVTLATPKVRISPSAQQLTAGEELALTASIPDSNGGTFSYIWTLSGSNLASLRGDGKAGSTIETSTPTVTLATTPSTQGTLTVKVEVLQKGADGQSSSVGDATSTITMTNNSNARNIVLESYLYDQAGGHGYVQGFLSFPLSQDEVYLYRITTSSPSFGDNQTFEIRASDLDDAIPAGTPLDADAPRLSVRNAAGNENFLFIFYHRGNNIYLYYQNNPFTDGISGSKTHAEEFLTGIGEKFHDIRFEVVPFLS